jgi:hypothetical protein
MRWLDREELTGDVDAEGIYSVVGDAAWDSGEVVFDTEPHRPPDDGHCDSASTFQRTHQAGMASRFTWRGELRADDATAADWREPTLTCRPGPRFSFREPGYGEVPKLAFNQANFACARPLG